MNERLEMAKRLIAGTHLREIRMASGRFDTSIEEASEVEEPVMSIDHGAQAQRGEGGSFKVSAMIRLMIFEGKDMPEEEADPETALAQIVGVYELAYGLPEGSTFSDEALGAFAETNGVFNAWPYFREFVQSSCNRMGLPALLVPLFRLSAEPNQEKDQEREPSAAES